MDVAGRGSASVGGLATALAVLLLAPASASARPQTHRPGPEDERPPFAEFLRTHPVHVAHRGGAAEVPEHTLVAYEYAIDTTSTEVLELDLQLTADGQIVVLHDNTVDRTTNGHGPVLNFTVEELKALDAGYNFTTDGGATYPWRGQGLTVPTLDEVMSWLSSEPSWAQVRVNIEFKVSSEGMLEHAWEIFDLYEMEEKICVGDFEGRAGRWFKDNHPEVCNWYPIPAGVCMGLDIAVPYEMEGCPDYDVLEIPYSMLTTNAAAGAAIIDFSHEKGIPVVAWTVDDEETMIQLLDMGVDAIMSDKPSVLRRVLDAY